MADASGASSGDGGGAGAVAVGPGVCGVDGSLGSGVSLGPVTVHPTSATVTAAVSHAEVNRAVARVMPGRVMRA